MGWLEMAMNSLDAARIATGLAANWLIQSTLLIAGGLVVGFLLRRRGSAVQSAVYRTTLVAVLICPLATLGLSCLGISGWSLEMPSAYALESPTVDIDNGLEPTRTPLANNSTDSGPSIDRTALSPVPPSRSDFPPPREFSDAPDGKDALPLPSVADVAPLTATPSEPAERSRFALQHFGTLSVCAAAVWIVAGVWLLGRLALGWRHLHRLRREARAADSTTIESCHQIAARLHVSPPEVLHSPYLPSPCLAGVRRPAVMLPETDLSLPVRDVLVHELAHLVRNDCFWNMMRQCATAVLFFQPLLWKLSRRLAATAEEVCDDYVVQFGGDRHEYAHRLVNIATLSVSPATAGVGIVSFRSMLASRVARILDTSRLLSTRVGNLLLGILLLSGLVATLVVGLVGVKPNRVAAKTSVTVRDANEAESAKEPANGHDVDDAITVRGVVVDPNGVPVSGADVYALRWFWQHGEPKPLAATRSDASGRFTITYHQSQYFETGGRPEQWREAVISAFASGYGPAWIKYEDLAPHENAKLQLAIDDVPIEGRILDLEGNPLHGVHVSVEWEQGASNESLTKWIAGVRSGQSMPTTSALLDKSSLPIFTTDRWPNIVTDTDGRFRIAGLGHERLVRLHISGDRVATRPLTVVTRRMEPLTQPSYGKNTPPLTNFGAQFEYTAGPSRPVEGFVRDEATGMPLTGVEITNDPYSLEGLGDSYTVKTRTDERGFYRLEGMPKGPGNEIHVLPKGQPNFAERLKVADPQGVEAVKQDIKLRRGVWVTGRISDKVTGRPVAARVSYVPLVSNALAADPSSQSAWLHRVEDGACSTLPDGTFRVVAVQGRGIIRVDSVLEAYPNGQGYEAAAEIARREGSERFAGPLTPTRRSPTAFKEINAASANDEVVCDFALDPGRRITIETVESNGTPIANVRVGGWRGRYGDFKRMEPSRFDLLAFGPEEVRTVQLHSKDRNLGKALLVSAAESQTAAKTITLEPCAAVTGRLVDADGQPLRGASLNVRITRDGELDSIMERVAADSDGRFHSAQILPGLPVDIEMHTAHGNDPAVVKRLEVRPGETIDLGTIDITSDKRPEMMRTAASEPQSSEKVIGGPKMAAAQNAAVTIQNSQGNKNVSHNKSIQHVKGQVLGPDGKAVAGATVFVDWVYAGGDPHRPQSVASPRVEHVIVSRTRSDAAGKFELTYSKPQSRDGRITQGWHLAAFAPGMGPTWSRDVRVVKEASVTLRLTEDKPLRGRLVDLEGKPLAGVHVSVRELRPAKSEQALLDWISEAKKKSPPSDMTDYFMFAGSNSQQPAAFPIVWDDGGLAHGSPALPADLQTNQDGRFELDNLGENRFVMLELESSALARVYLQVVTRDMKSVTARPLNFVGVRNGVYYGHEFEFVAEPTQPIEGTVKDVETGQPLTNIQVRIGQFAGNLYSQDDFLATRTDDHGHYKLVGAPQGGGHRLVVEPAPEQPYFPTDKKLQSMHDSFDPIPCDFQLKSGHWIVGRLTEQGTKKPIADATIEYLPLRSNKIAQQYPNYRPEIVGAAPADRYRTDKDGRFRVLGIRGAGILAGIAQNDDRFLYASLSKDQVPKNLVGDRDSLNTYLPWIVTGYYALREVELGDSTGDAEYNLEFIRGLTRRLKLVDTVGQPVTGVQILGRVFPNTHLEDPLQDSTVELIGIRQKDQRVVALLHPEKRIGRSMLIAAGDEMTVELQPCAIVRGRFLDADGQPVGKAGINVSIDRPDNWGRSLNGSTTDANGRFEVDLPPGMSYRISHYSPNKGPNFSAECEAKPGAVFELGDLADGAKLTSGETAKRVAAKTTPQPVASNNNQPATTAAPNIKPTATPTINGRVVGADGKPVAGAKIYWITWSMRGEQPAPRLIATTDQNGGFQSESPEAAPNSPETVTRMKSQQVVVIAQGHGMAYLPPFALRPPDPISGFMKSLVGGTTKATITLPADASIKGRVVNIDGQPVKNARISIRRIGGEPVTGDTASRKDLAARGRDEKSINWRLRLDNLLHPFFPAQLASVAPTALTGADGKFELAGVGADRLAQLLIEGDGITSALVLARTTPGDTLTIAPAPSFGSEPDKLHGAEFTHVAGPSKPVEGRVLDLDTGEPLVGAIVRTYAVAGEQLHSTRDRQHFAAVTDAKGHYRIAGLPIGKENKLVAFTTADAPYVPIGHAVNTDVTTQSVEQDFRLKRGTWAEGRAYDAATKKPLAGEVEYFLFRNAELERAVPGLRDAFMDEHYSTNADGKFRVPVLATRGILAFRYAPSAGENKTMYPRGVGAEKIAGAENIGGGVVHFLTIPYYIMPSNYESVVEVKPTEDQKTIGVDFALSTGGQISVHVVDEQGKPVNELEFYGRADNSGWQHHSGPNCEVVALQPGKSRKIFFFQRARNLVGSATIDTQTKGDLTVKLSPGGGVRGRLVNEDGEPITDATLSPSLEDLWNKPDAAIWPDHPDLRSNATNIPVDAKGKFQINGLIPGRTYSAWAVAPRKLNGMMMDQGIGVVLTDVKIEAGKTIDLGDIRPKSPEKRKSKEKKSQSNKESVKPRTGS